VLPDPEPVESADVLLVESTYGDRLHEKDDDGEHLASVVRRTIERQGKLIVPSFALGRVEELLYWINRLEREQRIPEVPVYVDSPMASKVLVEYRKRVDELDAGLVEATGSRNGGRRRTERDVCAFCTAKLSVVSSIAESRAVQESNRPAIVISASGMATGGRVLHHLVRTLPDERNTVLFAGYQAAGTRGRSLRDGAKRVRIHGQEVPVRAEIDAMDSMSAHADADEILRWLGGFTKPPSITFLVHGEPDPMDVLKARIERELGWRVATPAHTEKVTLP
jgi:metallo-beta-lactamase family protein